MAFWSNWLRPASAIQDVRAQTQSDGGGVLINSPKELEEAIRHSGESASGMPVNAMTAMRVSAVYACVRIRSGVPANMPIHIKRRVDERRREDATDHPVWNLLRRRPNRWQTPSQFKRMMETHKQLRGNAYALKVESRGNILEVIPLHPDRTEVRQADDLSLSYTYTRRDGRRIVLAQKDVLHLVGLSLDGFTGVSPITFARETIGASLAMERHGALTFKNGANPSLILSHPAKIGKEGRENLRASLDDYRQGGDSEGKALILEEGMNIERLAMSSQDAQWIEARRFTRSDIFMIYGIPPHMAGDTEKSTSWGTGIDSQTQGFVTFTSEDDLTGWEETINRDLIGFDDPDIYARFNRAALVKGDIRTRYVAYAQALQWGIMCPDEVRALEDLNPREDGKGGVFYDPPNTRGGETKPAKDNQDDPAQPA